MTRQTRAEDLAVVKECHGSNAYRDGEAMRRVFRRFGWDMLTDDALEMLADEYEREAAFSERINAENRAIEADTALVRVARERGADLAERTAA